MTHIKIDAKEKAKELLQKMSSQTYSYQPYTGAHYNVDEIGWEAGKKCALIVVDECLKSVESDWAFMQIRTEYWQKVKNEIEQL